MSELVETIELAVDARQSRLEALTRANRMLDDMGRHLDAINHKLQGLAQPVVFKKSAADIREMITQAERLGRFGKSKTGGVTPASLNPKEMAKALGYDPKAVEAFITQSMLGGKSKVQQAFRRQMKELVTPEGEFRNVAKAGKFFEQFTRRYDPKQNPVNALQMMFGGGGLPGTATLPKGATATPSPGGPISLVIPPAQIVATLGPGPIHLTIPAAQAAGVGGGAGGGVGGATAPLTGVEGFRVAGKIFRGEGKRRSTEERSMAATFATFDTALEAARKSGWSEITISGLNKNMEAVQKWMVDAQGNVANLAKAATASPLPPAPIPASVKGVVTQIRDEIKEDSRKRRTRTVDGTTTTDSFDSGKQVVTQDLKGKAREALLQRLEKVEASYQKAVATELAKPAKQQNFSNIVAAGKKAGEQARALVEQKQFAAVPERSRASLAKRFEQGITKQATTTADRLEGDMLASFKREGQLRKQLATARAKQDAEAQRAINREMAAEERRRMDIGRMYQARDRAAEKVTAAKRRTAEFEKQSADDATRLATTHRQAQAVIADLQRRGAKLSERTIQEVGRLGLGVMRRVVPGVLAENGRRLTTRAVFSATRAKVTQAEGATPTGGESWLARGTRGFTPAGFAKNLLSIGAWSAAVSALYAPLRLVNHSLQQMVEMGLQTARLAQTFRGVGGSTEQLRDDVLALTSAMGQQSGAALESAVNWTRLGLSRRQAAEATRVSLVAANVAEMSAAESTEHLSAVTAVYRLRVDELMGTLGMFNEVSNTARVRNADLLTGLSRVAAVGKTAGFSLAELTGILGAAVEISGETGTRIGTATKNIIGRFGRPDVQGYLQREFGVEMRNPDGSEKKRVDLLGELYVLWQGITNEQRTQLAQTVAGMHQFNRFAAMMDSYPRAMNLAVDAQLNLNSAQEENARIVATLKSQWASLGAEWDRLVAGSGIEEMLAETVRKFRNQLRLLNQTAKQNQLGLNAATLREATDQQLVNVAGGRGLDGRQRGAGSPAEIRAAEEERARRWFAAQEKQGGSTDYYKKFAGIPFAVNSPVGYDAWLKQQAESPFERGQAEFENQLQAAEKRVEAYRLQARTLGLVAGALERGDPERRRETASQLRDRLGPQQEAFDQATAAGDLAGQQQALAAARRRLAAEAEAAEGQAVKLLRERIALGKDEQQQLEEKIELARTAGEMSGVSRMKDELAEVQRSLQELGDAEAHVLGRYLDRDYDDVLAGNEAVAEKNREQLALLQAQEDVLQSIAESYQRFTPATAVGRLDQEFRRVREQVDFLQRFRASPEYRREFQGKQAGVEQEQLLQRLEAQQAALDPNTALGRFRRMWAERETTQQQGQEQAQRSIQPFRVGSDPTERLQREIAELERRIQATRGKERNQGIWGEERAELQENEIMLEQRKKELLDRQYEVQREINQLLLERNKEITKSFFGAGPEEMLRKLAAFRMAFDDQGRQRNPSLGQFFSMSPNMRQDFGRFNPNFDPEMMGLQREANRTGKPVPVTITNAPTVTGTNQPQPTLPRTGTNGAASRDPALATLDAAKETLDKFTGSVGRAGVALDQLSGQVSNLGARLDAVLMTERAERFSAPVLPQAGGNRSGTVLGR